jgi:hypothetical protein
MRAAALVVTPSLGRVGVKHAEWAVLRRDDDAYTAYYPVQGGAKGCGLGPLPPVTHDLAIN